jgi:predicted DNA binding CopG/RHH family protein
MRQLTKQNKIYHGTYGDLERVPDFLPDPKDLILKKEPEKVKVTLNLKKSSVDIFKAKANKLGGSYQRMMRNLIDHYAQTLTK